MTESESSELERLRAEVLDLRSARAGVRTMSFRVSGKGAVSVYGLQRFPVTLYKEQWLRIINQADQLRQFIAENDASLAAREDKP